MKIEPIRVPSKTITRHLRTREAMPWRFEPLATYNAERARGLVHTAEYAAQMAALQADFDEWAAQVRETL